MYFLKFVCPLDTKYLKPVSPWPGGGYSSRGAAGAKAHFEAGAERGRAVVLVQLAVQADGEAEVRADAQRPPRRLQQGSLLGVHRIARLGRPVGRRVRERDVEVAQFASVQ